MKKLTFLLLCFSFFISSAQYDVNVFNSEVTPNTSGMWIVQNKKSSEQIEGSYRLFNNDFQSGVITTKAGKKYRVPSLNYNLKADQLETKISEDSVYAFNTASIVEVEFDKTKFKALYDPEEYRPTLYEVIGKLDNKTILKHHSVKVKTGVVNPMTQQKQTPDRFIQEYNYYITNGKGGLEELKMKKRKILKLFDDSADEVAEFVSENDLSFKDDDDLKKIFNYYNKNS